MKPCSQYAEDIALMVTGDLEPAKKTRLEAHLEQCEGCRRSLAELQYVAHTVKTAQPSGYRPVSSDFHQRIHRAVHAKADSGSHDPVRMNPWRSLVLAAAAVAVMVFVLYRFSEAPKPAVLASVVPKSSPAQEPVPLPSFGNYQEAVRQSPEAVDALLRRQMQKQLQMAPLVIVAQQAQLELEIN